jgi:pyruvate, water dikinase
VSASELVPLDHAYDANVCGGKAAALCRLRAVGLPVPDGVVVPAAVPDRLLGEATTRILAWGERRAPYGLIARSSATAEDGANASFAGLYTSQFTPTSPDQLLGALRAVRRSAGSTIAKDYARARGVDDLPGMAMLVQPAVRPYAAGVLAAEVGEEGCVRWRIEAVLGLPGPLVSGEQAGEVHIGDRNNHRPSVPTDQRVLLLPATEHELRIPPGEWITLPGRHGGETRAKIKTSGDGLLHVHQPRAWANAPILDSPTSDALLHMAACAAAALELERIDVEWAITPSGALHLLQARPLTTPLADDNRPSPRKASTWQGIPASPGMGIGPAVRLPDSAAAFGAVLICGALGPEAVEALLERPAAVVSTCGGSLSHTAIIARELGIPCVTNVPNALTDIPSGHLLHVNGTEGSVDLIPRTPPPRPESRPA